MEISIVMTTYNGEKYIIEQMDSIYKQTMLAEEVLIFDDGSTDNTVDIISSYIKENNIANWKLFKNKDNLGWKKNFIAGFEKAGGQLIFPCDQDDIWELDKIEKMAKVMSDNHDINVLASNYNIFYENGVKGKKKTIMCNNNQVHRVNLNKKSIYNQRPGCVYAFRKSFFLTHKSLWIESMAHDEFLWKIALLTNTLYLYNFISIRYRRHLNAETLVRDSIEGRARRLRESSKFFTQLLIESRDIINNENKLFVINQIKFYDKRLYCFETKGVKGFLSIWKYFAYYKTVKNCISDYIYMLRCKN